MSSVIWYLIIIIITVILLTIKTILWVCPCLLQVSLSGTVRMVTGRRALKLVTMKASYGDFILLTFLMKELRTDQMEEVYILLGEYYRPSPLKKKTV